MPAGQGGAGYRRGARRGGGVLRARRARKTKAGAGAKGPRSCFVRAVRARRPARNAGIFGRPYDPSANLFRTKTSPQNERAAPDERPAGIFYWKSAEVFQLVFPRFFQKRKGGGAERRQWRKKRGGSPVSKGVEGSRFSGDAQRPLGTAGAERRQWRKKRGGSPVSKGVEGSRFSGDAQRPLGTAGAERRQWRKKRGGSPVSKGVEGSRFSGDAQRPLRTARGAAPPTGSRGRAPGGAWGSPPRNTLRYKLRYRSMYWRALLSQVKWARIPRVMRLRQEAG